MVYGLGVSVARYANNENGNGNFHLPWQASPALCGGQARNSVSGPEYTYEEVRRDDQNIENVVLLQKSGRGIIGATHGSHPPWIDWSVRAKVVEDRDSCSTAPCARSEVAG